MKEEGERLFVALRCVSVACVLILGLMTIVGTGGGETSFTLTVTAFPVSSTAVSLSWNGSVSPPSRFDVYVDNTFYASSQVNSTTVKDLDPDTRYCFKVYIVDSSIGITERSNVTCATTLSDSSPATTARSAGNAASPGSISLSQVPSSHDFEIEGDGIQEQGAWREPGYNGAGDDAAPINQGRASRGWTIRTVDIEGNAGECNAIAIDSTDHVHIAYYERNHGGSRLKLATGACGTWRVDVIETLGDMGAHSSMSVDSGDDIHLSYFDKVDATLKYGTNASGVWTTEAVDSMEHAGYNASIKVDSTGKVHISYLDLTNHHLKYATNASGVWDTYVIDSVVMVGDGADTSISLDSAGKIHISYYDCDFEAFERNSGVLKVATNTSGDWDERIIDRESDIGGFASMAVDSADRVHICYLDSANRALKYATNASGTWETGIIGTLGAEGASTSMAVDSADKVHIGYVDCTRRVLKYATKAWDAWDIQTVATGAHAKGGASIAVDSTGKVHISYQGDGGLKYATNR